MKNHFMLILFCSMLCSLDVQSQVFVDSSEYYKTQAAAELRSFESHSKPIRAMSRLFGDELDKAQNYLERAKTLFGTDVQTKYLEGIMFSFQKRPNDAISRLKEVVSENPSYSCCGHKNVLILLGAAFADNGETDLAIDAYKQGVLEDMTDTWPMIEMSQLFVQMGKATEATEAYYGGLNGISSTSNIHGLFEDVKDIATKDEIQAWKELSTNDERLAFLRIFWKRRDPNPIDQVNERLVEHLKRLAFARSAYGRAVSPWYDDRGRIYVRLGKPDQVCFGRVGANVKETETWFYPSAGQAVFFDFVNMSGTYELRSLLEAVEQGGTLSDAVSLIEERSAYHPYYANLAMKIRSQRDISEARANSGLGFGDEVSQDLAISQRAKVSSQFMQTNEYRQDFLSQKAYATNQRYVFDLGAPHLPMNCNFASFSQGAMPPRIEFYWTVPFSELVFMPATEIPDRFTSDLKITMKVRDMNYVDVETISREYTITANSNESSSHFFVDQLEASMTPGKYDVTVEIRNNEKDRVGLYRFIVNVKAFPSDTLSLSDIEIAQYVDKTLSKDKFTKPKTTLRVVPNPAAGILKTKPMTIYYEIYNLSLNDEGRSSYEVSYSIHMIDSDKSFFSTMAGIFGSKPASGTSSVTVKEGKSVTEHEYISFDISELPPGIARLEIKVKDLLSGKVSSSWTNVTILEKEEKEENRRLNQN